MSFGINTPANNSKKKAWNWFIIIQKLTNEVVFIKLTIAVIPKIAPTRGDTVILNPWAAPEVNL